jgi:hypothetical protein
MDKLIVKGRAGMSKRGCTDFELARGREPVF